jgi:hypothetical protein
MPRSFASPAGRIPWHSAAFAALVLLACALAPASATAQGGGSVTVKGHVIDRESGRAVAGATVSFPAARRRTLTDANGNFVFDRLPAGQQTMVVQLIGYLRVQQSLELVPGERMMTIRLARDAVALEGVTVTVDHMEQRRLRSTASSRVFTDSTLARFRRPSMRAFLASQAGIVPTRCNARDGVEGNCAWVRGEPTRVMLILDEQLSVGGLDDLVGIAPQELYRVEVYRDGALVVAYTRQFVQMMARARIPLRPLSTFDRQAAALGLTGGAAGARVGLTP